MMQDTQEGVGRVLEIVQSLKSFGRMDRAARVPSDLNEGILSTLKLLQHELKGTITVDLRLAELPLVKCNPGEINQVFLNIMMNAVQALKERVNALLTIESKVVEQSVVVTIADNGCGMDESVLSRLFEPFYTTKPVGEGTGLGLSIAHKIIEEHAGSLSVESQIGSGTCFKITIPFIE
jgi:signal transduction histidine kinase